MKLMTYTAKITFLENKTWYTSDSGKEYKSNFFRVTITASDGLVLASGDMAKFDVKDFCKDFIISKGLDKIKLVFASRKESLIFYPLKDSVLDQYGAVPALTIVNPRFMRQAIK